jgi:hypothetical protein
VQIGFLYLRYVGPPKTLWQWLAPYVKDDEVRCLAFLDMVHGAPLLEFRHIMLPSSNFSLFSHAMFEYGSDLMSPRIAVIEG